MAASFFFYDLETSGFDPRRARIMQFAGLRTDLDLKPIGEPVDHLIRMSPDILPDPEAVLVTGITPQQTLADGLTEAEFLKLFYEQVVQPETIFVGFNNIRFDDEFMRFLHYRNFYDAYAWQWADGCTRWDILDLVRMTRALRPDGIEWPFAPDGKPANRLEYLTQVNHLAHDKAHDALSDVRATIAVAGLIKDRQPELFDYLLGMRDKNAVTKLVQSGQPFVYTTGRYPSQYHHTSVAVQLAKHPQPGSVLVYDLRHDPKPFLEMSVDQIVAAWRWTRDPEAVRLPVKTMKYNRAPAVAPLGVIKDEATQKRIGIDLKTASQHLRQLIARQSEFANKILEAVSRLDTEREQAQVALVDDQLTVDARLYEGFVNGRDKQLMGEVRSAPPETLAELGSAFGDQRLKNLLPLYKARNYPKQLSDDERAAWDMFCHQQLLGGGPHSRLAGYLARIDEISATGPTAQQSYILEELRLYGQSLIPDDAGG